MKAWCKHKYGFVNMDDNFLYFTSTGNWSDTKDLGEFKEEKTKKSSSAERYKSISYLAVFGILIICVLWVIGFDGLSYASIIGLAWIGYSAYHYMATGLTGEFKIPYSNITNLEVNTSVSKITFLDYNGHESVQEIIINTKGEELFAELHEHLNQTAPINFIKP